MTNDSPWSVIKTPQHDYNVRKISDTTGISLYWGKDTAGHCLFIVELAGDQTELFRRQQVNVKGIKLDLRLFNSDKSQGLVIKLEKHTDQDIFSAMCQTLVSKLRNISDPAVALSVSLSQVKRWKAFMAGRKRAILSAEEIRGLFGELRFLQYLIDHFDSETNAVNAWVGPEGLHQDFIFSNTAVEIKSLSGRERNTVQISSEDQLESLNNRLFLKLFRLAEIPESDKAMSLNELVNEIESQLDENLALEEFQEKLAKAGYVELHEYDSLKFIVSEERTYLVQKDFPKLVRSELPQGITKVRYDIDLESIRVFLLEKDTVWEK